MIQRLTLSPDVAARLVRKIQEHGCCVSATLCGPKVTVTWEGKP